MLRMMNFLPLRIWRFGRKVKWSQWTPILTIRATLKESPSAQLSDFGSKSNIKEVVRNDKAEKNFKVAGVLALPIR